MRSQQQQLLASREHRRHASGANPQDAPFEFPRCEGDDQISPALSRNRAQPSAAFATWLRIAARTGTSEWGVRGNRRAPLVSQLDRENALHHPPWPLLLWRLCVASCTSNTNDKRNKTVNSRLIDQTPEEATE